jgi:hypothetical protein
VVGAPEVELELPAEGWTDDEEEEDDAPALE